MQIVIFSDVHGNVTALEAVLEAIRRDEQPDALFVAGDLVMVGPRPSEALALLRSIPEARFVMGNTDRYVVDNQSDPQIAFVRERLSDDDLAFLAGLPFEQRLEVAPGHELLVVHANPHDLETPIKPGSAEALVAPLLAGVTAEVIAFGHYHVPFTRQIGRHTLVDVASVGMPRDGDQRAVYVVLTWDGTGWQVAHRRVPFDIQSVARDYAAVGFPDAEQAAEQLLRASYG
ncbi:MAG TPA: metallophosphoesterase family protein [Roseiflexaceae bacterium]|nr:metallophosphoesterase family protein [Roseiflexaceae bacterium]